MRYSVKFYRTPSDEKPVADFLASLRAKQPELHKLVLAGIKKLENRQYHKPPTTKLVDPEHGVYELRVGGRNTARVFWFFQPGGMVILTNGYVKKKQELDPAELQRARDYKKDWEERTG